MARCCFEDGAKDADSDGGLKTQMQRIGTCTLRRTCMNERSRERERERESARERKREKERCSGDMTVLMTVVVA